MNFQEVVLDLSTFTPELQIRIGKVRSIYRDTHKIVLEIIERPAEPLSEGEGAIWEEEEMEDAGGPEIETESEEKMIDVGMLNSGEYRLLRSGMVEGKRSG